MMMSSRRAGVTPSFVDALAEFLVDYMGMVLDVEASRTVRGQRGVQSIRELRVMTTVFHYWRSGASCTVTQIANATGVSKTTVSRAVTSLMTNGLLREQNDPEDGRRRLLLPTDAGLDTLEAGDAWLTAWAERLMEFRAGDDEPPIIVGEKGS